MAFRSTKTYSHDIGLSVCLRQHKADSHCKFLHGYALAFRFVFEADELDARNWVVDFGGLKNLKGILEDTFDHTCLIAEDDPQLPLFKDLHDKDIIQLRIFPKVGCESIAYYVFEATKVWLASAGFSPRCRLVSVEVAEHGGNSAIYQETV